MDEQRQLSPDEAALIERYQARKKEPAREQPEDADAGSKWLWEWIV